jgi:ABC-type branched-subunit amino acid transport system permease subunit
MTDISGLKLALWLYATLAAGVIGVLVAAIMFLSGDTFSGVTVALGALFMACISKMGEAARGIGKQPMQETLNLTADDTEQST